MADIKWIKLSVNMFDDEKIKLIRTVPEGDKIIVIWVQLLCLAGKTNDNGSIYMGQNIYYTDEMLASICDQTVNIMRLALKTLEQFGMIESDEDGMIEITNWEKHQNVDGMERIRQQNAERQQIHYYRKKIKHLDDSVKTSKLPNDAQKLKEMYDKMNKNLTLGLTLSHETEEEEEEEEDKEEDKEKKKNRKRVEEDADQVHNDNNNNSDSVNVHRFFQENIGVESPYITQDIEMWKDDLNNDLVYLALQKAVEKGAGYSYAKAIMKDWANKNITSVEQANAEALQKKKQTWKGSNNAVRKENLPDWASDDHQPEKDEKLSEEEEKEFRARINRFREGKFDENE